MPWRRKHPLRDDATVQSLKEYSRRSTADSQRNALGRSRIGDDKILRMISTKDARAAEMIKEVESPTTGLLDVEMAIERFPDVVELARLRRNTMEALDIFSPDIEDARAEELFEASERLQESSTRK